MPLYYLLKEGKEQGPYTTEMIAMQDIAAHTLIRSEGSTEIIKAGDIQELQAFLQDAAKAAAKNAATQVVAPYISQKAKKKIKTLLGLLGLFGLVIIINLVNNISLKKNEAKYEQQLQVLEAEIADYKEIETIRAQQDRQVETARALAENELKTVAIDNEIKANKAIKKADLAVLQNDLKTATSNLLAEQDKLVRIKKFKFLRSGAEKRAQIEKQEAIISTWQKKVTILNKQISTY